MLISDKQISLIKKLHKIYKNYTGENCNIEDFIYKSANVKCFKELTHNDVKNLVKESDRYCIITKDQRKLLRQIISTLCDTVGKNVNDVEHEIIKNCNLYDLESLTKLQFESIQKYVDSIYNIYIPKKINWSNYNYYMLNKTDEYIIGEQTNISKQSVMNIISFKRLLVLDWDNTDLDDVLQVLCNVPYKFRVYKTYNGYHAYCTSHFFPHNDLKTLQIMKRLKCDELYISFSYYTGFVVRLTPKPGRIEDYVEKYIQDVNNQYQDIQSLKEALCKKDQLIKDYNGTLS